MKETQPSNETQPNKADMAKELCRYLLWHRSEGTQALLQSPAPKPLFKEAGSGPSEKSPSAQSPSAQSLSAQSSAHVPLEEIRAHMGDCRLCKLCRHRRQIVFGAGNPKAELVFVGEGPGADEDAQGIPFVGRAGQLLTKMIEAMHFSRDEVYICNVVKCRPPDNRNPEPDEIEACRPFLRAQLASIRPKVLVALGKFAVHTLLSESTPITKLRGRWREYEGIPLMPTYHPAYLLRNPVEKKNAWLDLQSVMQRLGKPLK
ncbi:MAG: uracil-DNA glycosylase [Cystobacterineae bacterium]|nr:uracil-DNA glycosylase [Cystobacterineae bacterium]